MIEIYSYYSVGGYKDLYLGNSEDSSSSVFFSPLLELWENGEVFDENTNAQMRDLATRPRIVQITKKNRHKLSDTALSLETKGGYKSLLTSTEKGYSLIIREIENSSKDEYGRPIPFLLHFSGNDIVEMSTLAKYACQKSKEFETILSKLFHYNPSVNALEFDLSVINTELKRIFIEEDQEENLDELKLPIYTIKYIMCAEPRNFDDVVHITGINKDNIFRIYGPGGLVLGSQSSMYRQVPLKQHIQHADRDNNLQIFETFRSILSKFVVITKEDEEDLLQIKQLINNIIKRKK